MCYHALTQPRQGGLWFNDLCFRKRLLCEFGVIRDIPQEAEITPTGSVLREQVETG